MASLIGTGSSEVITGTRFGGETMAVATNERVLAFEKDNTDQIPNPAGTRQKENPVLKISKSFDCYVTVKRRP